MYVHVLVSHGLEFPLCRCDFSHLSPIFGCQSFVEKATLGGIAYLLIRVIRAVRKACRCPSRGAFSPVPRRFATCLSCPDDGRQQRLGTCQRDRRHGVLRGCDRACRLSAEIVRTALRSLDTSEASIVDNGKRYAREGVSRKRVMTSFGAIEYERSQYRRRGCRMLFPADRRAGLIENSGHRVRRGLPCTRCPHCRHGRVWRASGTGAGCVRASPV